MVNEILTLPSIDLTGVQPPNHILSQIKQPIGLQGRFLLHDFIPTELSLPACFDPQFNSFLLSEFKLSPDIPLKDLLIYFPVRKNQDERGTDIFEYWLNKKAWSPVMEEFTFLLKSMHLQPPFNLAVFWHQIINPRNDEFLLGRLIPDTQNLADIYPYSSILLLNLHRRRVESLEETGWQTLLTEPLPSPALRTEHF